MTDLRERFKEFDEVPTPDEWERIEALSARGPMLATAVKPRLLVAVAASLVVLLGVGIPLLVIGSGDSPEAATDATSTTAPFSPTTSTSAAIPPTFTGWQQVAVGEPWVASIAGIEALPDGGFVLTTADPPQILWSPDGLEWLDADPRGQVTAHPQAAVEDRTGTQVIAAANHRVGLLDRANTGLWVGDPRDGAWEQVLLHADDLAGKVELLAISSNGPEMLVLASVNGLATLEDLTVDPGDDPSPIPSIDQYLVWIVDPINHYVERRSLPIAAHWGWVDDAELEWFNGRWVIYVARQVHEEPEGRTEEESLLVSPDGASWTATAAPKEWEMSLTSLSAGPSTMVATVCHFGGDSFWYSADGINWAKSTSDYTGHSSTYVDGLGFVIEYNADMLVSSDGRSWEEVAAPAAPTGLGLISYTAASSNGLLVGEGYLRAEETPGLWLLGFG